MQTLNAAIKKIATFLATHEDKLGTSGTPKQSTLTDNESAKMPTSKGGNQGYNGVAIAASQHQVIVHAEAFGEGQEHGRLRPMVAGVRETFQKLTLSRTMSARRSSLPMQAMPVKRMRSTCSHRESMPISPTPSFASAIRACTPPSGTSQGAQMNPSPSRRGR
jgi:hypothetical protein